MKTQSCTKLIYCVQILLHFILLASSLVQRPPAAPVAPPAGGVPGNSTDVRGYSPAQRPYICQRPYRSPGGTPRLPHHTGVLTGQGHQPLIPQTNHWTALRCPPKPPPVQSPTCTHAHHARFMFWCQIHYEGRSRRRGTDQGHYTLAFLRHLVTKAKCENSALWINLKLGCRITCGFPKLFIVFYFKNYKSQILHIIVQNLLNITPQTDILPSR